MDSFIANIETSQGLLENSLKLKEQSRQTQVFEFESVRKLSKLVHQLQCQSYNSQLHCVTVSLANILLKNAEFRIQTLQEDLEFVQDVQRRLLQDSQLSSFQRDWEIPLWRVLFLLTHGAGNLANTTTTIIFDRQLAPVKFAHLVGLLDTEEAYSNDLSTVLEEFGKFWYALSYNYGVQTNTYSRVFWSTLKQLNHALRRDQGQRLIQYSGALLQLCSLLLLAPENPKMLASFDMVLNLVLILKRNIFLWQQETTQQLYSPLSDYRIPQILHVLHVYLLRSPIKVRERIEPCITGLPDAPVNLKAQILELYKSPISGSDTREIIDLILQTLNLQLCSASTEGVDDILQCVRPAVPTKLSDSTDTIIGTEAKLKSQIWQEQNLSSTSVNTACTSHSAESNDSWTEEERVEEAERIMAAIRRLDQLGVITTNVSS
ncbi:LAFA_0E16468g1_1 [Lachancea sp. 'fantastica']|nr:LAFA_0E16468g1_1 [Lachancea sp. 'fantastica']